MRNVSVRIALLIVPVLTLFSSIASAQGSSATCRGRILNPISDICWSCIFPISIAGIPVFGTDQDNNPNSPSTALCACANNGSPVIGVGVSFYEPVRLAEVVRKPFCFPALGGVQITPPIHAPEHGRSQDNQNPRAAVTSFYEMHWYFDDLFSWMEVLMDDPCLEAGVFDLGYMTEFDPLWHDASLSLIINPDTTLFTSVLTQAACAADCIAATVGMPISDMFWCAGCQGPMYPLTGWVGTHQGGVQASVLLTERLTNKLHRQGLIWAGSGADGMCGLYPQILMDKANYKLQMVYPVAATQQIGGKCCQPYGRTTTIWESNKEIPMSGEDFAYQIYRKRDCCQAVITTGTVMSATE